MATRPRSGQTTSRRSIVVALAVAVLAGLALVTVALLLRDDGDSSVLPTPIVDLSGIPQEGPVLGSAAANVKLIEYADMQCPACREFTVQVYPTLVDDYVRPGKVKTEFRGAAFLGPDSEKALRFVVAAGLQNRLFDLQEALYRNQGGENSGWVTDDLVRELAADIPGLDVDRLFADKDGAEVTARIQENARQWDEDGVQGTPTIFVQIGDDAPYEIQTGFNPAALSAALDDALAG